MPYTHFTEVIQDDADAIRYIDGSTASIVFADMPNRILAINGLKFGSTDLVSAWVGKFLPYITGSEYITDMSEMFRDNSHIAGNPDFSNFSTVSATNMSYMFYGSNPTTLDLSNFDTSNVTDMNNMFAMCTVTTLDLSSFDTSSVTNMSHMLSCQRLTSLDLSNFDTSSVTNMRGLFLYCYSLTSLDLSSFNTSNVTDMSFMFHTCTNLTSLDLSNFDTSEVLGMEQMFKSSFSSGGKIWVPSTFVATKVQYSEHKPFYFAPTGQVHVYTDATDAQTQGWGTINPKFTIHYNSTYQDFINA